MKKYYSSTKEIDKELKKMIKPFIVNKKLKILDAGGGQGQNTEMIKDLSPKSTVDLVDKIYGQDILKISSQYDISVLWQVISFVPNPFKILGHVISKTKSHLFLSSLFYEGDIDFHCKVQEYKRNRSLNYVIFSLPRFIEHVQKISPKNMFIADFKIKKELPLKDKDWIDSYTMKLNGTNHIFAGPIRLDWKLVRIDL